jgi:alkanesulfonate monooxygenase SsuD/methylene tetrahydromethanopterin reductase-like flavin-dependent oxidoreductase (luciferase family)
MEREIVRSWTAPLICGPPDHVRTELEALAQRTGADELMITTMIHGPADRLRSYELLAETWDLSPLSPGVPEASV